MSEQAIAHKPLRVPFTKMHGLGNDFMVVDMITHAVTLSPAQIRQLGDRHRGVGFDQLLIIEPPQHPDADFNYRIFNADGSEVEHCGNGARCFAQYVLNRGLIARSPIRVQTRNRLLQLHTGEDGLVSVEMGEPDFAPASLPFDSDVQADLYALSVSYPHKAGTEAGGTEEEGAGNGVSGNGVSGNVGSDNSGSRNSGSKNGGSGTVHFRAVSMGNPHIVLQVDNCEDAPVHSLGAVLCKHPAFPQGVNVGFMQIVDRQTIRLRVFERGAGETEACGTGACAAVVCGIRAGLLDSKVRTLLNGGELTIEWAGAPHAVIMTGPATTVFEGTALL
jgi:diaminopimelate epimerase